MATKTVTGRQARRIPASTCVRLVLVIALWLIGCGDASAPAAEQVACRATAFADDTGGTSAPAGMSELRWRVAGDSRAPLDAWCAGVGPALAGNFTPRDTLTASDIAGAAEEPVLDSLLVVTWNVHVGGGDVVRMIERLRAGELTGGAPVRHFVMLLQETFQSNAAVPAEVPGMRGASHIDAVPPGKGMRWPIDDVAREHDLAFIYAPSMRNGQVPGAESGSEMHEDRGNGILSTLPLEEPWALELPLERQRRVVVVAHARGLTAAGEPWRLQLASVHLEPQTTRNPLGITPRVRQVEWLLRALPPEQRAVLAGDLNARFGAADEPAVRRIRAEYPQPQDVPSFRTYDGPLLTGQVDFIFARGVSLSGYARVDEAFGSDHWPVLAWIGF